jgi:hypothetical protein
VARVGRTARLLLLLLCPLNRQAGASMRHRCYKIRRAAGVDLGGWVFTPDSARWGE